MADLDALTVGRWLLFVDIKWSLQDIFANVNVPFDADFTVARQSPRSSEVFFTEVYRVRSGTRLQEQVAGNWSETRGATWTTMSVYQRRHLDGIVLKGVFKPEPPYVSAGKNEGNEPIEIHGFCAELIKMLQHRMNFKMKYYVPEEPTFGTRREDGTWSGLMGEVTSGRADIGLNLFMVTAKRAAAIEYFPPIFNTKMILHIKLPGLEDSDMNDLVSEFTPDLWVASMVTFVLITLLLTASWWIGVKFNISQETESLELRYTWLHTVGFITQKSIEMSPVSLSCGIIYLMGYLLALVLFVAYGAILISFLTISPFNIPFTDFEGFLRDGTYALGVVRNSEREAYFKNSNEELLKKIYKKLIEPYSYKTPKKDKDGLRQVCFDNKYSYFCTQVTRRGLERTLPCVIIEIPHAYFYTTVTMIMQRSSPYKRFFTYHLQEIKRTGMLKRINMKIWRKNQDNLNNILSVSLNTVGIFYVILAAGAVISILLLFLEIAINRFQEQRISTSKRHYKKDYTNLAPRK
ncbi:probable glutamate receptor [Periplaneta americana]|uniref:probable glutamate receptor n=1 Tax=Periplaneta americana TaxID=6978 RepID=UPI0037E9AC87